MATANVLSNYGQNLLVKQFFFNTRFPVPPSTVYLAAYTTAPTNAGTGGVEVSGANYSRVVLSTGASGTGAGSAWSASGTSPTVVTNATDFLFPVATNVWGTIVAVALWDQPAGGNLLVWTNLTSMTAINTNDQLKLPAGTLTWSAD